MRATARLGLVVYLWDLRSQDLFLRDCLGPAVCDLREAGLVHGFWFDRFDARGPHLFALLATHRTDLPTLMALIEKQARDHLALRPCRKLLSDQELAARHAACRGKVLCAADREPGPAENNSLILFEHPAGGYPFSLARGLRRPARLWKQVESLTLWSLAELAEESARDVAAVRLIASLSHALAGGWEPAMEQWRYHAATLLPRLDRDSGPPPSPASGISLLAELWEDARREPAAADTPLRLVRLLAQSPELPLARRRALLRDLLHVALKQLAVPVRRQIPLILYAWHRSAQEEGAAHDRS